MSARTTAIFEDEPGWDPYSMGNGRGYDSNGNWNDRAAGIRGGRVEGGGDNGATETIEW